MINWEKEFKAKKGACTGLRGVEALARVLSETKGLNLKQLTPVLRSLAKEMNDLKMSHEYNNVAIYAALSRSLREMKQKEVRYFGSVLRGHREMKENQ